MQVIYLFLIIWKVEPKVDFLKSCKRTLEVKDGLIPASFILCCVLVHNLVCLIWLTFYNTKVVNSPQSGKYLFSDTIEDYRADDGEEYDPGHKFTDVTCYPVEDVWHGKV